jgi:hypothetical protein
LPVPPPLTSGRKGWHGCSLPTPLGATLLAFARRKPSEIPSRTQSVSAFLPDKGSAGAPLFR